MIYKRYFCRFWKVTRISSEEKLNDKWQKFITRNACKATFRQQCQNWAHRVIISLVRNYNRQQMLYHSMTDETVCRSQNKITLDGEFCKSYLWCYRVGFFNWEQPWGSVIFISPHYRNYFTWLMEDKYHALFCKRLSSTISLKASFSLFSNNSFRNDLQK